MQNNEVFFPWSPEYNIGIQTIDDQHRVLVNTLNRLAVAVSKHEGGKVIAGIFDALMSYTRTHFNLEERLMRQAKYADLEAHIEEHHKLIGQLEMLFNKHFGEEEPVYSDLLDFMKIWLKEHIQGVDTRYSAALSQSGFSAAEWERDASAEFTAMSNETPQWWKVW